MEDPTSIERVHYRERQILRSADLSAEQDYRIAMRRRHNIGGHGWGIVFGLELDSVEGDVVVLPGMAVDGYGREVIVAAPVRLPTTGFDEPAPAALDVWLLYGRDAESSAQRGRWACGPGQEGRWIEAARIRLRPAVVTENETGAPPDDEVRRAPVEVADADLSFGPQGVPPDDPDREWPIFLGTIPQLGAITAGRPYATLAGAMVRHPTGAARLQLGPERAGDRRRFAVGVADGRGGFRDRIVIDNARNTIIDGDAELLDGKLTIGGPASAAALPSTSGLEVDPAIAPPTQAAPWQIYRAAEATPKGRTNELRAEIAHPGENGDPRGYRLAIGRPDQNAFHACLSVLADGTVQVHGQLEVDGQVIQGPIRADPNDPRFGQALVDGWAQGSAATGSAPRVAVQATDPAVVGAKYTHTVSVSNPGTNALSIIALQEHVYAAEETRLVGEFPHLQVPLLLAAYESVSIDAEFTVPADAEQPLAIMIVAVATDAIGRAWYGHGTASVPLESGIN